MFTITPGFTIGSGWTFSSAPLGSPPSVEYLVVAGGSSGGTGVISGAGGARLDGAGGGAGGYRIYSWTTSGSITF